MIAADGMWSPVRKALGFTPPGYLGEWHAFRQYVRNVEGPAAERLIVWFDEDVLPGYLWSFPLPDGRANIGFGVVRDGNRHGKDMKAQWDGLLDRPHVRAAIGPRAEWEGGSQAWPIPARIDQAPLGVGRVLLTGDAAMATDVLTGEGIGQALLTGRLAAEAIIEHGAADPAQVLATYRRPRPRRAPGRPSDVGAARPGPRPPPRRQRRHRRPGPRRRLGPSELRPLDVRGRTAGDRADPPPLAPPPLPPPRRRATPSVTRSCPVAPILCTQPRLVRW